MGSKFQMKICCKIRFAKGVCAVCLDNFAWGGGGMALRKKVTNFTFLTDYFSIENVLTTKEIIIYTLNENKVRANNGMKV